MLQHYMWREAQEPLAGGIEMQAAKMNTAFVKAHRSLKPGPVALEARHFSGRTLLPTDQAMDTVKEAKASGSVVC